MLEQMRAQTLDVGFVLDASMHALDARTTDQLGAHDLTAFHYRVLAPAGWERCVIGRDWDAFFALPGILTPRAQCAIICLRPC